METEYRAYVRGVECHQRSDPVRKITRRTVRQGLRSRFFQRRLPGNGRLLAGAGDRPAHGLPPASAKISHGCAASTFRSIADTPEGSGVCGQAFRDQKVCVSNDFLNDARSLAWREGARRRACRRCGGAAADLQRPQRRRAARHHGARPARSTTQIVSLLERMSANISFALDNFEHEAARKRASGRCGG